MALTVTDYVGYDGLLAMNTWLGTDGSASDRLVIVDGAGAGQSRIQVRNTGGGGAVTESNGIPLVQAINATTSAGAFSLSSPVVAGPYEYFLYQGGVADASSSDTDNSWFLRSVIDCSPQVRPPPCPAPPPHHRRHRHHRRRQIQIRRHYLHRIRRRHRRCRRRTRHFRRQCRRRLPCPRRPTGRRYSLPRHCQPWQQSTAVPWLIRCMSA